VKRSLAAVSAGLVMALAFSGAPSAAAPPDTRAPPSAPLTPQALALVHGGDIPTLPSPAPSAAEWKVGLKVRPTRGNGPSTCELLLVREWLRIRCAQAFGAGLVAGDAKGVSARVLGQPFAPTREPGDLAATVVLPIQRGQARIVGFNDSIEEYDSRALGEGPTFSIVWRDGRADPVLAFYAPAHPSPAFRP